MRKLEGVVKEIVDELGYLQRRESKMRDTNGMCSAVGKMLFLTLCSPASESTNSRVQNFSLLTLFILIGLGAWQVCSGSLNTRYRVVPDVFVSSLLFADRAFAQFLQEEVPHRLELCKGGRLGLAHLAYGDYHELHFRGHTRLLEGFLIPQSQCYVMDGRTGYAMQADRA